MFQAWEAADFNSKDLQKLQGLNLTVNQVVRTEQPNTTRPNQGGNSGSATNTSCKHCERKHHTSECMQV